MKRAHEEDDGNAEPAAKKDRAEEEEESKVPARGTSGTEEQQPPAQPVPPPPIHEHDNSEEEDNSDSNSMENEDEEDDDDDDDSITYLFPEYDWKYDDGVFEGRHQDIIGEVVVFHSNAGIGNGEEQVENAKMLLTLMPTNAPKSVAQLLGGALRQERVNGDGEETWRPIWVLGSNLWSSSSDTAATSASGSPQQPWTPGISDVQEMLKQAFGMEASRIETRVNVTRLHAAGDDGLTLSSGQEIAGMDNLRGVFRSHAFGNTWFYIHIDVDILTPYFIGCFVGEGAEKSDVVGFAAIYSCFVST